MQKLLLYLLFIFPMLCFSQNKRIEISGTLTDQQGKVVDAHIINITSKQGTFSDDSGNFIIPVKLGDELKITSVQHNEENLIVANINIKRKRLDVELSLKDNLLEEVEIKKTYLSGRLGTDAKIIKKSERQELMENLGFDPFPKKISQIDREIYAASTSNGIVSLDLIINTLSGRIALLKKKREILENEKKMKAIERTYTPYIINDLKIDSNEVARFLFFCHLDKDFSSVYKKDEFKMIEFLKNQAKLYNEKRKEK